MDLKYLSTFRTIVEEGSFTKAAKKLNYTQSTITFQMNQLEQELSIPLFEKIGRKMVLTKAGERLVPYVSETLESVEKLHSIESDLSSYQGNLRLGIAETQLCYRFSSILKEFHQKAPKAHLILRSMNCYDIRDELLNGTLDIGVFYEDVGGFGNNLATYEIGSFSTVLVTSPEMKRQYPDFTTPNQTIPLSFIINEPDCIFRQMLEEYLRRKSIRLDHTIELWSIPTIKNLVESGIGFSFLPRFTVQEELESGILEEIEISMENPTITAVCGHHKNKWVSPLMQLFIDLCKKYTINSTEGVPSRSYPITK